MEYQFYTLPNGIKLVHKNIPTNVAHCGFIINTGSRDELLSEHGMAHFIEHVIFKGTKKRKAYHVISRIEDVGGELDAYTTKEDTCIYASFLHKHYERTIELFSDIIFNSTFPAKEIQKEKDVIYDEINSYKDSPAELIFDDFEEVVFKDHALGRNILGTFDSLKQLNRQSLLNFIEENYNTDQMVLCSVGNISFKKLVHLLEKYFGNMPMNNRNKTRNVCNSYKPNILKVQKDTFQTHCIAGNIAYKLKNKKRTQMVLLNNILGGPNMNSRLNLSLREKHGFAYNIESFYNPYEDTGVFGVYFGTDNGNLEKSLSIVKKELDRLKEKPLGKIQLHKAKQQLIGQLAIATESYASLMLNIGKSYLLFNKVDTLEKLAQKIEAITTQEILDVANEVFDWDKFSMVIYE
jgi:predicted Zn-dependent peptidase